jgi:hypothetical protein
MPGRQNRSPIRGSCPIPSTTAPTSPPTASQRSAISLTKLIFVARNALLVYLISSASVGVVVTQGDPEFRNRSRSTGVSASFHSPATIRAGFRQSARAVPWLRNSGLCT